MASKELSDRRACPDTIVGDDSPAQAEATLDWYGCDTFRLTVGELAVFLDACRPSVRPALGVLPAGRGVGSSGLTVFLLTCFNQTISLSEYYREETR
jgi:hypothetical protein